MLACAPGFFCPNGTTYAKQFPCPPGSWSSSASLADATECDVCPKGKYCVGGKSFIDGSCSPGYYCPLGTESATKFPCPSGTYTSKTWLFEPSQCDDCPPGFYCPAGSVEPIACKPGSFTSLNRTERVGPESAWPSCVTCPAGYFCVEASVVPEPCGKGRFSTAGSKACSPCEAGYFCGSTSTSYANMKADTVGWASPGAVYGKCYNGTYCPPGSDSEPALAADMCPAGYYCPTATPQPMICPAGTYSNFTGQDAIDDCVPTPAGYFSVEGALAPTGECSPGFYCPLRSTSRAQVPCPARYYLNRTGGRYEDDCALCVSGSYCPKGSAYPVQCPPGSYCRTGVGVPEPCPIGTYANASGLRQVEDCVMCAPGMYCDATGLTLPRGPCDPGYYCTLGAYTSAPMNYESTIFGVNNRHTGAQCPQGAYCPLGSATPTLCPPGTFNNFTGLETETQCVSCPPGRYCETPGLFLPTGDCFAGYYCIGGSQNATQFASPPGFFSLTGATAPTPCPLEQFNLHPTQDQCVDCPAGFYCGSSATVQPLVCPTGSYCPKSSALPLKCSLGTFSSAEGLVAENQCEACPAGYFCDSYGLSAPSDKCFEGFVCTHSSPVANPVGQPFGFICPAGQYCPEGSGAGVQCPNGTFRASVGGTSGSSCAPCPGGLYCGGTALTAPTDKCGKGHFCISRASSATPTDGITGGICPAGFFCESGTINPVRCTAGTYALEAGQSSCSLCPAGFFCDGFATDRAFDCPTGRYCPIGTAAIPLPCPAGTFNKRIRLANVSECAACTAGFYCGGEGLDAESGACSPGFYCPTASVNKFGKTAANDTHPCPAGAYCPEGTYIPILCPRGTYSNTTALASAKECTFCDEGSYCADTGLTGPTGLCVAGYFCKRNNTELNPSTGVTSATGTAGSTTLFGGDRCPAGSYCVTGSASPRPCSEGTYADELGASVCKVCAPGYFCPLGTAVYSTNTCPQGYYCPEGTKRSTEYPCPPGTFGNATGLQRGSQCSPAPGGMYVDTFAAVKPTGVCKSGFYCSGGSMSSTPSLGATGGPCLPGTNCPEGSAVPIVCDAGYYCSSTNTDRALPCDEGFYCVQGSYTANPTGQNNSLGIIGDICTSGHYCPKGSSNPIPCPPGTYSGNTQNVDLEDCFPCSPGYLCPSSGTTLPSAKCPPGFVCIGGERGASQQCPTGSECPEGSSYARVCSAGSFSDEVGLAQCKQCPERYFCGKETVHPQECPPGFYCPLRTPSATSYPCPPGTYSNWTGLATAGECAVCPPGKFCSGEPPTSTPSGDCAPGYFCAGRAKSSQPADGVTGGRCTGGFMCFGGAWQPTPIDNRTGRACDTGYYCPEGSSSQIRCPKGTYNSFEKQTSCTVCPAGGYCNTNATAPMPCPQRYFCPRGTVEAVVCPNGTFGHQVGLESADQCAACSAGKYCTGGVQTASCAAGYYCKMFNVDPNPAFQVNTSKIDYGGPCPIGHYCPEGVLDPFPCPNFTARVDTHGSSVDDCGLCPAGMSCEDGAMTMPCPRGNYCVYGKRAVPCPEGTYNPFEGKRALEDCLPCAAGKLCNRTGVIDPADYNCPPGHYCLAAESSPRPCPIGRFRRAAGGRSVDDCQTCAGGSYCVLGSIEPTVCGSKTYCPIGSGLPSSCPGGSYCAFNSSRPTLCPEGYYCLAPSELPSACDQGHYCPAGTAVQLPCPLGYIGRTTPLSGLYTTLTDACESCPPGTFGADPTRLRCETCLEGFVCLGATASSHPLSRELERGYECPPGFYCPAGSSRELACPSGTYQPESGATNATFCRECPSNSYQNVVGQSSCLPCSKSAYSAAGAIKCTCVGSHRAFQMTDGYCICEPGYEFYDQDLILRSDEDDDVDCQPIVYDRCGSSQVRSESGSCVSTTKVSCDSTCNNGTGTYVSSLGLCQCDQQPDLDIVCDEACRASSLQMQVNSATGKLQLYDPATGQVESIESASASRRIVSKVLCTTSPSCQLHAISIDATGFSGSYGIPASLPMSTSSDGTRRRRLSSDADQSISNPMVCVNVGSGILFDLSAPDSYPIYLKDSMLNTNPRFDYGTFRSLATKVKSNSSSVAAFAFTFSDPGVYVFGNSLNSAAKTVVAVMSDGTTCPTDGAIVPLNEKNLIAVSAKRRTDDLILAPDWGLIVGLLGGLFGMVAAIIGGLYYFRTKSWTNSSLGRKIAGYRAKSRRADLTAVHSKGSLVVSKTTAAGDNADSAQKLMALDADDAQRPTAASDDGDGAYQADLGRWDDEDLDVRELVDRLQHHHESVEKCFEEQKGDAKQLAKHLHAEVAELKRLLVSALLSPSSLTPSLLDGFTNPEVTTEPGDAHDATTAQDPTSGEAGDLQRNSRLLENMERELVDRTRYEKRKAGAMAEATQLLREVESWRHALPELARTLAEEMARTIETTAADQPETTTASRAGTELERIHSTLGDLHTVLCSDPTTTTSSSLVRVVDTEKARREIGAFVLDESQRHLHSLHTNGTSEGGAVTDAIKRVLDLREGLSHAQNREDATVQAQVDALRKFGVIAPKVHLALTELECDFKRELSKLREEQNPSKERTLQLQLENKLSKLLTEMSKGAAKVCETASKEDKWLGKCEQACQDAAAELVTVLNTTKIQVGVLREQDGKQRVDDAQGCRLTQIAQSQQRRSEQEAKSKARDEAIFQIKDLLVALTTQLNARQPVVAVGPTPAGDQQSFLPALSTPVPGIAVSSLPILQRVLTSRGIISALRNAPNPLEALERKTEAAVSKLAESHAQMEAQYRAKLQVDHPHLLPEEKERLLGEFTSDLLHMTSAVNVETTKSQEDMKGLLSSQALVQEKHQRVVQEHADRLETAIQQEHQILEVQLESQYKQEEMEIEQAYREELSRLEQEFEAAGEADFGELDEDYAAPPEESQESLEEHPLESEDARLSRASTVGADQRQEPDHTLDKDESREREPAGSAVRDESAQARTNESEQVGVRKGELKQERQTLRVDAEPASAAYAAADSASEAEIERLRREFFDSRSRSGSEHNDAAAASSQRLKARLAGRLRSRQAQSGISRVAEHLSEEEEGSDSAAFTQDELECADALLDDIQRLQDAHYLAWKGQQERSEDDHRRKKAQLAARLERKRTELQSKVALGTLTAGELEQALETIAQEEEDQSVAMAAERTEKVAQVTDATHELIEASSDALVDAFANAEAEIDRRIADCRRAHEETKRTLEEQLEMERRRQRQSLQDRIAKRRERLANSLENAPNSDAETAVSELDALDEQEAQALEDQLCTDERTARSECDAAHNDQLVDLLHALEQDAKQRVETTKMCEQEALDELARITQEHREQTNALQARMDAEKQRQSLALSDRLQKRRDARLRELQAQGVSETDALAQLAAEEQLERLALDNELLDGAAETLVREAERQRAIETELRAKASRASLLAAEAKAAKKALERAQALERDRVQDEYARQHEKLAADDGVQHKHQKQTLLGRLAARKREKRVVALTEASSLGDASASLTQNNGSDEASEEEQDDSLEQEIQRVKEAHDAGWKARLSQLELDAAMKKARLVERMQRKRDAALQSLHQMTDGGSALNDSTNALDQEEADALSAIEAELQSQMAQLQTEVEDGERAVQAAVGATAKANADELERMLAECRSVHDEDLKKLQTQQALDRQQRELSLQARLAKKRAERLANQGNAGDSAVADVDAELQAEERRDHEVLAETLEAEGAAARAALDEKHRGEMSAILQQLDEETETKRTAALEQQHDAARRLELLQQEHRESIQGLNDSLAAQKSQQESRLQQRLLDKRVKKKEELKKMRVGDLEAQRLLSELDQEQALQQLNFAQEWERDVSRKLKEEADLQQAREQEIARQLSQAALDAASADATRRALEAASRAEIDRVASEFQAEVSAAKKHEALEAKGQRQRLQDRLAEKKLKRAAQGQGDNTNPKSTLSAEVVVESESGAEQEAASEQDRLRLEHEVQALAEAAAWKKQADAVHLQEQAEKELERLKEEHENEMKNLNTSLQLEQKRQEQKLQERIAKRRERKQQEVASSEVEKERLAVQLEEEERKEREALEAKLAARAAQVIQEERVRQAIKEAELAARIGRAATEAAEAEAARKAMEAARELEIERLSREFDEKSKELRQSNQADLATQKKKLEARIAAKKHKKLMELEAKKELELQKLREKQARDLEAIKDDQAKEPAPALVEVAGRDERAPEVLQGVSLVSATTASGSPLNAVRQQASDIAAIEQLFELGLVPRQLSLMAGVELVVNQRHQQEASALFAMQYEEKVNGTRRGMSAIMQQKASVKALALSDPSAPLTDKEAHLLRIEAEFDEKLRALEHTLLAEIDALQFAQAAALKQTQLAQIEFLIHHFAARNAVATAAIQTAQLGPSVSSQPAPLEGAGAAGPSSAESELADLVHELRARLQIEKSERIAALTKEKQARLLESHAQLERELAELAARYVALVDAERAEIDKTFNSRVQQLSRGTATDAQRCKFEAEKDAQVARLVLMLRGRQTKHAERLRALAEKRRAMLEDEFAQKAHVVAAKMAQRVVEEKETLVRKQAMLKGDSTANAAGRDDSTCDAGANTRALEERLARIEDLLRERLIAVRTTADDAPTSGTDSPASESPSAAVAAVVQYRTTLVDAVLRGWRVDSAFLPCSSTPLSPESLAALHASKAPVEDLQEGVRKRLSFLQFVLQLASPRSPFRVELGGESIESEALLQVAVVRSFDATTDGPAIAHRSYVDDATQTLFLDGACLADLTSGQVAVLALHALAHASSKRADVSDPAFFSKLYELLVQCYQSLFRRMAAPSASVDVKAVDNQSTLSPHRPTRVVSSLPTAAYQWQTRLLEVETFLSTLQPGSGLLTGSTNSNRSSVESLEPSASRRLLLQPTTTVETTQRQHFQEQLDAAEKRYTQALQQCQEQHESLEYVRELLADEEEAPAAEGGDGGAQTRLEAAALEAALTHARGERDKLFAQCQTLRDALRRL